MNHKNHKAMTNREWLDRIGNAELAKKIKLLPTIPGFQYIDWESWLNSTESEFSYIGTMCKFKPYDEMFAPSELMSGVCVDSQIIAGIKYKLIVSHGAMYKIPENRVFGIGEVEL